MKPSRETVWELPFSPPQPLCKYRLYEHDVGWEDERGDERDGGDGVPGQGAVRPQPPPRRVGERNSPTCNREWGKNRVRLRRTVYCVVRRKQGLFPTFRRSFWFKNTKGRGGLGTSLRVRGGRGDLGNPPPTTTPMHLSIFLSNPGGLGGERGVTERRTRTGARALPGHFLRART